MARRGRSEKTQGYIDKLDYIGEKTKAIPIPGRTSQIQLFEVEGRTIITIRNTLDMRINHKELGKNGINGKDIFYLSSILPEGVYITGLRVPTFFRGQMPLGVQVFTSKSVSPKMLETNQSYLELSNFDFSDNVRLEFDLIKNIARVVVVNSKATRKKAFGRFLLSAYIESHTPKGEKITNEIFEKVEKFLLSKGFRIRGTQVLQNHPSNEFLLAPIDIMLFTEPVQES